MADPLQLLRKALKRQRETQSAFAARCGIDRSEVSHILAGRRRPGLDYAVAIERGTGGAVPVTAWGRNGNKAA